MVGKSLRASADSGRVDAGGGSIRAESQRPDLGCLGIVADGNGGHVAGKGLQAAGAGARNRAAAEGDAARIGRKARVADRDRAAEGGNALGGR